jgi:predicted small lipoprotein YifL
MRHTITSAALLAAVLALSACGGSGGSKAAAKPSPSPTVSKADQYLKVAHGITFNGSPTDTELLALPPKWCDALDAAHSVKWMFDSTGGGGLYPWGAEWGTAQQDADTLVVAGVKAYCPRNLKAVADELRASGEY